MNAKSFNLSVQGASHIKKNKECQDASRSYSDENIALAIVCDGHGGDDYMRSAVGSMCACNAAERNIKSFLENTSKEVFFANPEKLLNNLEASIINVWNQLIYAHYEQNPFSEAELSGISEKARKKYVQDERIESAYGTTLIAVAMTHGYWFGIHIGDGKCVAINPEGKFVQPIPWDSKCFLNATTSICDSDALSSFRHFYSEKLPVAVFVGSDGIDDCFSNNEQLHNLYKTILYSFGTSEFEEALDGLKDYLPRLSAKGSGDDVSIAAMLDFDLVPELEVVKEFDREKEKARVEENARKEAEKNEAEKRRVEQEHARFQRENNSRGRSENKPKFCTECGAKLSEGNKFCSECGAKIVPVAGKIEPNNGNRQIQLFPIKRYQSENTTESVSQQEVGVQDVELNERMNTDNEIELENTQVVEDGSADVNDLNTDENAIAKENVNSEQQEESCEIETNSIEDDLAFKESVEDVQILDNEATVTEVEHSENEVVGTLADEIIQETQKADI